MVTIPECLDWLWFLGYDLDDEIPDLSVLSKARGRWGVEDLHLLLYAGFFRRFLDVPLLPLYLVAYKV